VFKMPDGGLRHYLQKGRSAEERPPARVAEALAEGPGNVGGARL